MGKGDRRTARGKRYRGSHGNARPHGPRTPSAPSTDSKGGRKPATRRRSG
jgi:30S ribosomal protein S31